MICNHLHYSSFRSENLLTCLCLWSITRCFSSATSAEKCCAFVHFLHPICLEHYHWDLWTSCSPSHSNSRRWPWGMSRQKLCPATTEERRIDGVFDPSVPKPENLPLGRLRLGPYDLTQTMEELAATMIYHQNRLYRQHETFSRE